MKKRISLLFAAIIIVTVAFSGCSSDNSKTDETGATVLATADETAIASGQEDLSSDDVTEKDTQPASTSGDNTAATAEVTQSETKPHENTLTTVNKADTSDMDFDFDDEDTKVETKPEATKPSNQNNNSKPSQSENITNITVGGTYTLSGNITDKTVTVDAGDEDVTIILDGVNIKNSKGPAIYVRSADKLILTLNDGTVNTVSDGSSYNVSDSGSSIDAAIFSKTDLTINGYGSLTVNGNYKHGVASKDDLVISSGTLNVNAKNIGLNGKDCVKINSGSISVNAGSDGVRADNSSDRSKGFVYFYGGTVDITSANDGIQAETVINIENVELTVTSGGGGTDKKPSGSDESFKGLKAGSDIYITGGSFNISSLDDCIHSNGTVTIGGGNYIIRSGDDGIHADTDMLISGGTLKVNTLSKGIDVNGDLSITGGEVTVCTNDKAILDFDLSASISGGSFIGTGSADKSKNFSHSTYGNIAVNTGSQVSGANVKITDSKGKVITSLTAEKPFTAVIISSSFLEKGETYTITAGSFTKTVTA